MKLKLDDLTLKNLKMLITGRFKNIVVENLKNINR